MGKGSGVMELGLRDRVVFVTGGSSGIGQATAVAFGHEGAKVGLTYRANSAGAAATVREVTGAGGEAPAVRLDLADAGSIRAAVAEVPGPSGGIGVFVSTAADTARHADAFNPPRPPLAPTPTEHGR